VAGFAGLAVEVGQAGAEDQAAVGLDLRIGGGVEVGADGDRLAILDQKIDDRCRFMGRLIGINALNSAKEVRCHGSLLTVASTLFDRRQVHIFVDSLDRATKVNAIKSHGLTLCKHFIDPGFIVTAAKAFDLHRFVID
jgi:hypothetical protein